MGLDQYLYRIDYIRNLNYKGADAYEISITKNGKPVKLLGDPSYIKSEIQYWRKSNAIHQWFVNNCQGGNDDCGTYPVKIEDIEKLLSIINQILESKDKHLAEELLPTRSWFFFGSQEYDEWYFKDLEETKNVFEEIIKAHDSSQLTSYEYSSSW